jgi:pimeloyl-ACP methyl ester carboxylesterase
MKHLLLLHGALGSSEQLLPLIPMLSNNFQVHALNFSGHGGLPIPQQGFNFQVFANDILQYMDTQGIQQASFFGYSMGGYAALYFAKQYPDRVGRIFTLGTKFDWSPDGAAKEVGMLNADKIAQQVPAFAAHLQQTHQPTDWKAVLAETANMMLALGEQPTLQSKDMGEIPHPTTISVGDRDHMAGLPGSIWAYQSLPNAYLWVLPGTPHPFDKVDIPALASAIKVFM